MEERIRIGMVGSGAVARAVHLPILSRRSDLFEVVAICDPSTHSSKLAADRYGVGQTHTNIDELLDNDLDAVMATHSGTHTPTVLAALNAGMRVFSEKPLAYTRDEIDAISATAKGQSVMVGYMKAYDPAVVAASGYLAELPKIRSIEVVVLHPTAAAQLSASELEPPDPTPATTAPVAVPDESDLLAVALGPDAASALGAIYSGVLLGSISHDLAVMRAFNTSVEVVDRARLSEGDGGHRSVALTGRSDGDADVSIRWHYLPQYPSYREEVRFHTDAGSVELVFPAPYLLRAPTELRVTTASTEGARVIVERSPEEAFERELVAFAEMVRGAAEPKDGIDSGMADVITAQKIAAALAGSVGIEIDGEAGDIPG